MKSFQRSWAWPGLGAAALAFAALTACGGEPSGAMPSHPAAHVPGGDHDESARGLQMQVLPVEKRLALLSGHVAAGLALYRAGVADDASVHLSHPVSDAHADEVAGFKALGFRPELFRQILDELDAGKPAAETELLLAEAETHLADLRRTAGGDPKVLIEFLMKTLAEAYDAGVDNSVIVSLGDYQDAYGLAVAAREMAGAQDPAVYGSLKLELDVLVLMWPGRGPVSTSLPPPEFQMVEQLARVKLALASLP